MRKIIKSVCLVLWKLFGKSEHVPCRWCMPKVSPLCTDECSEACVRYNDTH